MTFSQATRTYMGRAHVHDEIWPFGGRSAQLAHTINPLFKILGYLSMLPVILRYLSMQSKFLSKKYL